MGRLIDSNILLRWIDTTSVQHAEALATLTTLREQEEDLIIAPQNIVEFWSAATRPAGPPSNGLGLTVGQAEIAVRSIEQLFRLVPDVPAIYTEWRRLVVQCGVSGRQVYDARIAATMIAHGITHLLTFNVADFRRYPGIVAVHPREVVSLDVEEDQARGGQ